MLMKIFLRTRNISHLTAIILCIGTASGSNKYIEASLSGFEYWFLLARIIGNVIKSFEENVSCPNRYDDDV